MKEEKNFIWNVIGLSFNAFISLFLLIIVKRINGIDKAGIFTYAFSLSCLFFMISCFYSRTFQVSDYKRKFTLSNYFTYRLIFALISLVLVVCFSFINGFGKYKSIIILLLMIYKIVESLSDSVFGQIQIEGNLYKTGISYTIKSTLGLIVFIILDLCTKSLSLSIIGLFMVSILILLLYDIPSLEHSNLKISINREIFKKIFIITLPIFLYTFFQSYLSNVQKMIMTYFVSNKMQTIFAILIMPATMVLLVGNYIIMPFINNLTEKHKNKEYREFDKTVKKICAVVFILGLICVIGAYLFGIPVLNYIYNVKLNKYIYMLIIVLIGAIFNSIVIVLSNILTILGVNKKQTIIYFIMSFISTLITIILTKIYKIEGLCCSYLITFILLMIIYFIVYKVEIKKIEYK